MPSSKALEIKLSVSIPVSNTIVSKKFSCLNVYPDLIAKLAKYDA